MQHSCKTIQCVPEKSAVILRSHHHAGGGGASSSTTTVTHSQQGTTVLPYTPETHPGSQEIRRSEPVEATTDQEFFTWLIFPIKSNRVRSPPKSLFSVIKFRPVAPCPAASKAFAVFVLPPGKWPCLDPCRYTNHMEKPAAMKASMQKHYFPYAETLLSLTKLASLISAHISIKKSFII